MAARLPLVLVNGAPQQLQPGDFLTGASGSAPQAAWTNGDAGSHVLGDVVYVSAADTVKKAKADAAATASPGAIALATATIANGAVGQYQTGGILAGLAGLTAGAVYYLSAATAGLMTTVAPSTPGQYVQELGVAISTTEFLFRPRTSILL